MATASLSVEPDEMKCSDCHEHFKKPKVLPCGHVLCRHCLLSCLQSQNEALCPLCRCPMIDEKNRKSGNSLADIADDFLTDRAMGALVEAHRLLSEQHVCCVCDNVAAVSMCMDCRDMFCQQCTTLHKKQSVSKHHAVEQLTSLTEETLAANYRLACPVHSDKLSEVFCPAHKVSVCLHCATTVHRQCPDLKNLKERVTEARVTLHDLTAILTARETEVGQTIRHLDKQLTDIDQQKQAAIAGLTTTFDEIEAAEKESRQRLNDLIVKTSDDEKQSVNDVKNIHLSQRGKLTLHKRLVARSEAIITRDDVTDITPDIVTLVKDLDRSISSQANVKVTSRLELVIDPAEVTRIKKALLELGKGKGSSFDDGTTARIKLLEQKVQQLQRDLTSAQSEVMVRQQELANERHHVQVLKQEVKHKDDQIKRNEAEIVSCKDDFLSKVKEMEQQEHMYEQLQTELQGEKASYQDTAKQLQDSNKTCSALEKELQGKKARHQNTTKQLTDCKKTRSAQEHDVASYQRQRREFSDKAPLRETSVTKPSGPTQPQTQAFYFHKNHGKNVVLSKNKQTAEHRRTCDNGIVMSRDPMEVNKLYEVQITKRDSAGPLQCVGVVTSSPGSMTLPRGAMSWQRAVVVYSSFITDHGDQKDTDIGKALENLPVDSRVGLSLHSSRNLHLHVNGADQGVVPCRPLPDPCWTLWELNYTEMTSLPVRDLT